MIRNLIDIAPRALAAALLGAVAFVGVQFAAGATTITALIGGRVTELGGYPAGLAAPIGWAVHLGVSVQYAFLFAALTQLPVWPARPSARRAALLAAAVGLGWATTLITAPAITATISLLAGAGFPETLPGLYTKVGLPLANHIGFFLICFAVLARAARVDAREGAGQTDAVRRVAATAFVLSGMLLAPATLADTHPRSGDFYAAEKRTAAGQATVAKVGDGYEVQLSDSFATPSGPDLYVVLIQHDEPRSGAAVRKAGYVRLARLQKTAGSQTYAVPSDLDLSAYDAVGIWCERFSVLFSAASLGK